MRWKRGCDAGSCVEVGFGARRTKTAVAATVVVRNSMYPGAAADFTEPEWVAFVDAVKRGDFDLEVLRNGG